MRRIFRQQTAVGPICAQAATQATLHGGEVIDRLAPGDLVLADRRVDDKGDVAMTILRTVARVWTSGAGPSLCTIAPRYVTQNLPV
jgi:hypothetical protein